MTFSEKRFYRDIEKNRGIIKNNKKFEPIICDIYLYGIEEWLDECTVLKRFGLQFIHDVVTSLDATKQKDCLDDINSLVKPNIYMAKLILQKYK